MNNLNKTVFQQQVQQKLSCSNHTTTYIYSQFFFNFCEMMLTKMDNKF